MYVIREITQMSMAAIGNEFGGRDHSTVVYATSQVVKNMKQDTKYKENCGGYHQKYPAILKNGGAVLL